jgi:hypothetical protein
LLRNLPGYGQWAIGFSGRAHGAVPRAPIAYCQSPIANRLLPIAMHVNAHKSFFTVLTFFHIVIFFGVVHLCAKQAKNVAFHIIREENNSN